MASPDYRSSTDTDAHEIPTSPLRLARLTAALRRVQTGQTLRVVLHTAPLLFSAGSAVIQPREIHGEQTAENPAGLVATAAQVYTTCPIGGAGL